LLPYAIEAAIAALPGANRYAGMLFAVDYAAFGAVMMLFLLFEPRGLVGIWRRVQTYFLLWPFKHRPLSSAGK
jgi:branched-chain amino acid transport system permease protein